MFAAKIIVPLCSLFLMISNFSPSNPMPSEEPKLIINMADEKTLPRNFRMTQDSIHAGHEELQASASGQFSKKGLEKLLETLPEGHITIIDLREESHGFINDIAVSWFSKYNWANKNKPINEIIQDEKNRLYQALNDKQLVVMDKKDVIDPFVLIPQTAYTEEELVTSLGCEYIRLPVSDHIKPTDQAVDDFLVIMKDHLKNNKVEWIHFHCAAGRGRTTTFIAFYDMILNASRVSFEDIIKRQALIGGKDLGEPFEKSDWRYEHGIERLHLLSNFYKYCLENPNLEESWSSWNAKYNKK